MYEVMKLISISYLFQLQLRDTENHENFDLMLTVQGRTDQSPNHNKEEDMQRKP